MAGGVQRIVCVRVSVWVAGWVGGGGRLVCSNFVGNLADLFSPPGKGVLLFSSGSVWSKLYLSHTKAFWSFLTLVVSLLTYFPLWVLRQTKKMILAFIDSRQREDDVNGNIKY